MSIKLGKNISPKVRSLCFALKGPARLRLKRSIKRNLLGRWLNWIISFLKEKSIFCKAVAYVLRDLRVSNSFCWPSFEDCTTLKAMKPKMLHQLTHLCAMGQSQEAEKRNLVQKLLTTKNGYYCTDFGSKCW